MDSLGKNINCQFTSKTVFLPGATIKSAEEKISEIPNLNRYLTEDNSVMFRNKLSEPKICVAKLQMSCQKTW